jgi:hypothetical protein
MNNTTTCSNATVGYELDINKLVGNNLPIQIPEVVVKWITYALVLHIVAFGLAGIAAIFGLLAHIREMSMSCFSSCIAGFAAVIALFAFIFDIAFFFIAKSRLDSVKGGSASFGNAAWLTLAAWILLFLSGCFYGLGRCCIKRRPRKNQDPKLDQPNGIGGNNYGGATYADQMRLDAVKAEVDRKVRQKQGEVGLPAFQEYDPSQPLHAKVENDEVYVDDEESVPYRDNTAGTQQYGQRNQAPSGYAGGYVQGTPGNRAIDEFNSPSRISNNSYPPPTNRQNSGHTQANTGYEGSRYEGSRYEGSQYSYGAPTASPPPANNQYLSTTPYQNRDQYAGPPGQDYGHAQGGTSYHSTATHQQYPTAQYDAYNSPPQPQQHYQDPGFNSETYNNAALLAAAGVASHPTNYHSSPPSAQQQLERNYTLGGGGYDASYGANQVPDHTQHNDNQYFPSPYENPSYSGQLSASPAPLDTNVVPMPGPANTTPVKGPRTIGSPVHQYSDSPPDYENGPSQPPGWWGVKR